MPASVVWYDAGNIILFTVRDPLTLDELQVASAEVWTLAEGITDLVDMIFDFCGVVDFPRGSLPIVRDGHFSLPTLDRVALVGTEPLVEMMMTTLARATFRPDPTLHSSVEEAAEFLRRMAQEETHRQ